MLDSLGPAPSLPEPMADTMSSDSDTFDEIEALLAEPVDPDATTGDMTILFEADSNALTDADEDMLRGLAGQLDANRDRRLQLRAYASSENSSASDARRLALSRALAVRAFLIENNVRSTRIDVRALGDKAEGGPLDRIDIIPVNR
ncbi:MAG: OmpA family protein [Rhodospirillales bacterium]|nr:OmpA family protein [Rhodospirillales bacterium]